jgi:hypothetical protein
LTVYCCFFRQQSTIFIVQYYRRSICWSKVSIYLC